ncbi:cellulase family glycosylhydrolase [Glycomyces sp. TRM65418]|uniref:cellulase family glycosylhydrolase n=1 Tax=Glycomyces sp. TRM65418 TaxID=2867006 RepID=UPI001CE63835|nr:cellulase family glycosylhydrolase [Glycomyces sp. TRM65418]MCC3763343.1 cellulase family glycosylhydrolase [Glycomyces sp. TRM65418]QZD57338.1 cellulase family glycosylhydrolase [Glycomyces sp. TRM65418]
MQGVKRRTRRWIAVAITAVAAIAAGLAMLAPSVAYAAEGCKVDYKIASQWNGGFTGDVKITNLGDPINGWDLAWTFPDGQRITQIWNASFTNAGDQVTAKSLGYNRSIATDGSVSFGFNGSWSGANGVPALFHLNGVECTGGVGEPTTSPTTSPPPVGEGTAMETVAAMEPGWNLGNSLDSVGPDETAWGNPRITQELIENVAAQGYNSIRIPVTFDDHQAKSAPYAVEDAYLDRVEEVVGWALEADLYVLVNIHHDSWIWMADMNTNRTVVEARYEAIWNELATRFRDAPPELLFESVNEPQFNNVDDATAYALLDDLNVSFHEIVRGSGGNNATRVLVLPTLHTNADQGRLDALSATIDSLNDPNLAATVHYYGFWPFSVNVAGFTKFNAEVQADIEGYFDRVYNEFVANDIPVIVGEWGLLGFDAHTGTVEQGEKLKFFEYVGYYARQKGLTLQVWDNGQHFNRTTFEWRDPELYNMMKASWSSRSGTASTDQVFVAKSGTVADVSLQLNPNGTTFQHLRLGSTNLVRGTDYTISGDTLTIKASRLTSLLGDRSYGVKANLHAVFSQGAPWRISVISYDQPTMSAATGSTGAFAIPTQFNGDQLATMEAEYADGSAAGPHNWTTYKEFARAFSPDYTAGTISLPQAFWDDVNDGQKVTLTFHFWSGKTVTYYVTESGGNVTGSLS